jgi:shikimate dehydrogenase
MKERVVSMQPRICGLIGDPVGHSVSPAMHNAAFRQLGLDYIYLAFCVKKEDLSQAINGMRALSFSGFNVTIPHKTAVVPLLNQVDDLASEIGAVNTIVNDNGVLTGYNTDAGAFLRSLIERRIDIQGRKVIIIGAGGAARAISFALMHSGANLYIHNRSSERAAILVEDLTRSSGRRVESSTLERRSLKKSLEYADMLVNTTSIGMTPTDNETPVPPEFLRAGLIVFDVVYNPLKTRLIRDADIAGATTISGIDMLVFQGADAFEKFTGKEAPLELMRREAIRQLEAQAK